MNTALILCGFVGFVMLVVGEPRIVPELAIDSPLDPLVCLAKGGFSRWCMISSRRVGRRRGWRRFFIMAVLYLLFFSCSEVRVQEMGNAGGSGHG